MTAPAAPAAPPSPAALLRTWALDRRAPLEQVVAALADPHPDVDRFIADEARALRFANLLLADHVFELGLVLADAPKLSAARWLALARLDPAVFAWNLEPEAVLPLHDPAAARALEELLLASLSSREERSVLIAWLAHPDFLSDDDAIDRIEAALAASGAALTWDDRLDTVKALARRGGRWEAARALERLLRRSTPTLVEAAPLQRIAVRVVDATLLTVLGRTPPFATETAWLDELAAEVTTDDLLAAFAPASGETLARRRMDAPSPAHRAAYLALARRPEASARDAVARLIVRCAVHVRDEALAASMIMAFRAAHQAAAVRPLVSAWMAGLHRSPLAASVERFLMEHPEVALRATLDLPPDWHSTFDPEAVSRLSFRLVPRLSPDARSRVREEARFHDGARARILLDELDA